MKKGPDFLGIGAQKAGTTWLHRMLKRHPQIGFAQGDAGNLKEVHFWDKKQERGLDWYVSLFQSDRIMGDITPAYAILPARTVRSIYELNPRVRMIYILRNPVERAWSAALMTLRMRQTGSRASGAVDLSRAEPGFFLRHFEAPGSLARGHFADTLKTWFSVFPREALLVLRYESVSADPRGVLAACASHIGADAGFFRAMDEAVLRQRAFASEGERLPRPLYEHLLKRYDAPNRELEALLGWDLADWRADYDSWLAASARRAAA